MMLFADTIIKRLKDGATINDMDIQTIIACLNILLPADESLWVLLDKHVSSHFCASSARVAWADRYSIDTLMLLAHTIHIATREYGAV